MAVVQASGKDCSALSMDVQMCCWHECRSDYESAIQI